MVELDWDKIREILSEYVDELTPHKWTEKDLFVYENSYRSIRNTELNNKWFNETYSSLEDKQAKALTLLMMTFFKIEGELAFWMNLVIFYYINLGKHDIWHPYLQRFVTSFDEISDIPFYIKAKFLEAHGFWFIEDFLQKDLRNAIAHQDYLINEKGEIELYRRQKRTRIIELSELAEISSNITRLYTVTIPVFGDKIGVDLDRVFSELSKLTLDEMFSLAKKLAKENIGKEFIKKENSD